MEMNKQLQKKLAHYIASYLVDTEVGVIRDILQSAGVRFHEDDLEVITGYIIDMRYAHEAQSKGWELAVPLIPPDDDDEAATVKSRDWNYEPDWDERL